MDLIYANEAREDVGILLDYAFDLAIGANENDFVLTVDCANHCCKEGYFLYIEGTEYGGIIDAIQVKTATDEILYSGRTWHGILAGKIIEPDAGEGYLTITGEANSVIASLVARLGVSDIFAASEEDSGIEIKSYDMNRYIDGYAGIRKMLASAGGKLRFAYSGGKVVLSAVPAVDYSRNEQFDNDQVSFDIKRNYRPLNHVICLGKGELAEREVIHLYADENGEISHTQTQTGINEVAAKFDYPNAESSAELEQGGIDMLKTAFSTASLLSMGFALEGAYDIDDIVGAKELATGISASEKITKKIVTINKGKIDIEYKVGG